MTTQKETQVANTFTTVCNLTQDPEAIKLGERDIVKIRVADNTYGKRAEPRYLNALLGGPDFEAGKRLRKGDQVVLSGTLVKTSYKATKGKMKGKTVESDEMPFAKLIQVTRSETFFASSDDDSTDDNAADADPDISDDPAPADADDPLAAWGV